MTAKYGPNTAQVEAFLALLPSLTVEQWEAARGVATTWSASARTSAWAAVEETPLTDAADTAREAAWNTAWDTAYTGDAAWETVWDAGYAADAALALVVRDLISREDFDTLTAPFRAAGVDFDALGKEDV